MLILVAVSISIIINSGLIEKTKTAAQSTSDAYDDEANYGEKFTVGNTEYNSIDEYIAVLNGGANDTLTLTEPIELATESRASIVRVSLDVPEPTEAELQALESTPEGIAQVQDMFVRALGIYWNWPEMEWEDIYFGENDVTNIEDAFDVLVDEGYIDGEEYDNAYDFIIALGTYTPRATFTCNGQTQINVGMAEFVITKNGQYTITASKDGETGSRAFTATECKVEEFSDICTEKTYLKEGANGIVTPVTSGNDTVVATVPAGFAYGTSANVGKVDTGLVITDSVEQVGNTHYSTGNEFVWIPVDSDLNVGTGSKKMAQLQSGSSTNYEGVLYDYTGTGANTTSTANTYYTASNTSYCEPRILTNTNYIDTTIEPTLNLQTKYNTMIGKVQTAGGFYVGRYELGAGTNEISKLGVTQATAYDGCTNEETGEGALRWYGLYNKAGTYTNPNDAAYTAGVTTEMIWGSEWDAMLNFALEGADKGKINDDELGVTGIRAKTGLSIPTDLEDSSTYDKIINIYDLGGGLYEMTLEAFTNGYRVYRGGCYNIYDSHIPASYRIGYGEPICYSDGDSARATLYVN